MAEKKFFLSKEKTHDLLEKFPTPIHVYDEKGILNNAERLKKEFSWNEGFREFFAVKATPNPKLLELFKSVGFGVDCSSLAELLLAEKVGFLGNKIMFTSNETSMNEYDKAIELGAIVNLDDITHIEFLGDKIKDLDCISFRYNPGPLREGNVIIGDPAEAKFGLTRDQLFEAYAKCKELGVKKFGLHTMVVSNELDVSQFRLTAEMLFELVNEISEKVGIEFDFVNMGGGFGVAYKPEKKELDFGEVSNEIREMYDNMVFESGLKIYMEHGRIMTGPYGYLLTKVVHFKHTYKEYVGVDACMANLMRPGMYGAYHHIEVLGKEDVAKDKKYDVVGSLCENNDKFAVDRELPEIEKDDILVIFDSGAHGHSMGFNYNGKLRSAEVLVREDGSFELIRRAETYDDLFATLNID